MASEKNEICENFRGKADLLSRGHGTVSGGRGARRSSLTSVVLQEHNSRIDNGRGGVGRGWLADWCKGLGISSNTR